MVPDGNQVIRLTSVNHTTKTIYHRFNSSLSKPKCYTGIIAAIIFSPCINITHHKFQVIQAITLEHLAIDKKQTERSKWTVQNLKSEQIFS